jgi:hypothetical protein
MEEQSRVLSLVFLDHHMPTLMSTLHGEWHEFTSDSPIVNGYCFVGESLEHIQASGKIGSKIT